MTPLIVTGTDTGIGKTVVAAMLTLALDGIYWKPLQSGTVDGTDTERVRALTGLSPAHFRPESYVFTQPLSPHRASELDGVTIDPERLKPPQDIAHSQRLIVEGAGGLLVPIDRRTLQIEFFARLGAPAVLVARTALGTINHTLLSIEALRARSITLVGVIFVGEAMPDSEETIVSFGKTKRLGRLPVLSTLNAQTLRQAFHSHFNRSDFHV